MRILRSVFLVALSLISACSGNASESSSTPIVPAQDAQIVQEIQATGIDKYFGQTESRTEQQGQWEVHFFNPAEGKAICLFGAEYQISIRRGASNNVLFYLQGGGACWSAESCLDAKTASDTAVRDPETGILDASQPNNPFKDWNLVFVSYCDGSVFSGDNVLQYRDVTTYHHGLENLGAAVTTMQRTFPTPDKVFVAGSSAGGYGVLVAMLMVKLTFPDRSNWVLSDSGPGIQNLNETTIMPQRDQNWPFPPHILPASCTNCAQQPAYLYEWAISRDPNLRVGLFSALQDVVIRSFLLLDGPAYEALLLQVTNDIASRVGARYHRFFIAGPRHTVLLDPAFYILSLNGITMAEWMGAMVNNNDAGWPDLIEQ